MSDNGNGRLVYAVHTLTAPGGDVDGNLAHVLRRALDEHQARHGCPPARVVVNPRQVEEAVAALAGVEVISSGGCLAWECWLAAVPPSARAWSVAGEQLALFEEVTR